MKFWPNIALGAVLAVLPLGVTANAQKRSGGGLGDDAPTFFFDASGGYSVYKSELVQSNDTAINVAYGFGTFAGVDRTVGMALTREEATFAFALNGSKIAEATQDLHLRYRLGFAYVGVVVAMSDWQIDVPPDLDGDSRPDPDGDPAPIADAIGRGYGGNFGLLIPLARRNRLKVDLTYAAAQTVQEKALEQSDASLALSEVTIGPRLEADVGGSLELTKRGWLQATAGFKYRTYELGVLGTTYKELHNTTYLGFRLEADL